MCQLCGKDMPYLDYHINPGNAPEQVYCPNHTTELILTEKLNIPEGIYQSEISGQRGAVLVQDSQCKYLVTPDEALRLLGHSLRPEEYLKLVNNDSHDQEDFLLHDDFYDYDGTALAPMLDTDDIDRE